ncbi:ribosomal-protein-alanine N-acetyltransferase [Georgenia yuyongxinii]|uniref:Ribosomal-protein-alanine N-acetyltransferase n=1 Tax=Georgenia yuyongxinii TaxID=2589797 RepID=A0A5B8C757_9MICO|nr:ribosomal protein S18-alanine N-acetyltransferase [Georgenia yuyongxinii]QDC25840.1 ribosomal-protein-alanine N-acetyltransferase [Georgenia yuyongxinii]
MTAPTPEPDAVRLRPLTTADLGRVLELEPQLFGAGAWSRGTYIEELAAAGRTYVAAVIEADGAERLVGYAGVAAGEEAQVMTVGVAAGYRRRGIGTRLLDALVRTAAEEGARSMLLEVRASDEGAQALYARAGFVPIGRRRNYYLAEREDAVVMRKVLRRGPGPVGNELGED